jgi:hypothetical protein
MGGWDEVARSDVMTTELLLADGAGSHRDLLAVDLQEKGEQIALLNVYVS